MQYDLKKYQTLRARLEITTKNRITVYHLPAILMYASDPSIIQGCPGGMNVRYNGLFDDDPD